MRIAARADGAYGSSRSAMRESRRKKTGSAVRGVDTRATRCEVALHADTRSPAAAVRRAPRPLARGRPRAYAARAPRLQRLDRAVSAPRALHVDRRRGGARRARRLDP